MAYDALNSIISRPHIITNDTWTVSICRDTKKGVNPFHVFLIIEGLDNGKPFLHYAHLVAHGQKDKQTGRYIIEKNLSAPQGYAKIILNRDLPRQAFLQRSSSYLHKTFAMSRTSAEALIMQLETDEKNEKMIPYNLTGQAKFTAVSYGSRETHSCASYAQWILVNLKNEQGKPVLSSAQRESIKPSDFKAFLKGLVITDPTDILPEENERLNEIDQQRSSNCLIM